MKKIATLLTTLLLSTSTFACDVESFVAEKKEELVDKSEKNALNILKCDKNLSIIPLVKEGEWSCKFSTYTLKNIEQSGGFEVEQSRSFSYISSIIKKEGEEPVSHYDETEVSELLEVLYQNNYISFVYKSNEILSLNEFGVAGSEKVFIPEIRTIDLNSTLNRDSFNISASDDSLLILFWRGE